MSDEKYYMRIEFENCEMICVSLGKHSNSYINMENINKNMSIAYNEYGYHKKAGRTFLSISRDDLMTEKLGLFSEFNTKDDMWSRLQQYDDITNISFYKDNKQFDDIFVEWNEEDEEYNAYQKTYLVSPNTIDIEIKK